MANKKEKQTETTNNNPSHIVFSVQDRESKSGIWTRVGAAWPHEDGNGFNVTLHCVPVDGKLTIRAADSLKGNNGG